MTSNYQADIQRCIEKTYALPTGEIKYYLLLLINSLKEKNTKQTEQFITELLKFIDIADKISHFKADNKATSSERYTRLFTDFKKSYQHLSSISKIDRLHRQIGYFLLNVGGAVLAFLTGVAGGLIGGFAGFFRGIYNFNNPFVAAGVGAITGYLLGASIGFRVPKLLKDKLTRQIKFSMDGINECINTIQQSSSELEALRFKIKDEILRQNFAGDEQQFQQFLMNENVGYDISTLPAQFISESLEGYLGHHSFIKITINDKEPQLIEFSTGKTDFSRMPDNIEDRTEHRFTSGENIVEMLAFHAFLQKTHAATTRYILTKMKSGDVDCLSYINKILIGTSQKATKLGRFDGTENWVGRNIVSFFIKKLSPFKQDILKDDVKPECECALI